MECPESVPNSRLAETAALAQECSCGHAYRRKVLQLEKKVERLEGAVMDRDALITSLRAKNRQTTAELVEFQLQKVSIPKIITL